MPPPTINTKQSAISIQRPSNNTKRRRPCSSSSPCMYTHQMMFVNPKYLPLLLVVLLAASTLHHESSASAFITSIAPQHQLLHALVGPPHHDGIWDYNKNNGDAIARLLIQQSTRTSEKSPTITTPLRMAAKPTSTGTEGEDALYVSRDDDDVTDDEAYLPSNVPSKVMSSSVEADAPEDVFTVDGVDGDDISDNKSSRHKIQNIAPKKAQTRRNVHRGGREGGGGRGRGRGTGRMQQQRGRGRGQGQGRGRGGRGRGRGRGNWNNPALVAAKALNREIVKAETPQEVLNIFASRGGAKGLAGDGVFNSVNYSTCLHRLARIASAYHSEGAAAQAETRKSILSDPRFAIFVCSMAEVIVGVDHNQSTATVDLIGPGAEDRVETVEGGAGSMFTFNSREFSNTAWAMAKLKFAPPASVLPIVRSNENFGDTNVAALDKIHLVSKEEMVKDFIATSLKVRAQVLEVAKERNALSDPAMKGQVKSRWIPTLSQLGGKLLDLVAVYSIEQLDTFSSSQEVANVLYSFASAGRADAAMFNQLAQRLIEITVEMKATGGALPKPQECSNSIWSFATAGIIGPGQRSLVRHIADSLDDDAFAAQFKPQELSNTAWASATLLSKRSSEGDDALVDNGDDSIVSYAEEDDAVLRILRCVASSLESRVEEFKPQEISNTVWAMATVGFGSVDSQATNPHNEYIFLTSNRHEEDKAFVAQMLEIVARSAVNRLDRFRPQELNNLAWGFARLGHWGEAAQALFHGIGRELLKRKHYFKPQDIGTCLWSFATMEYFDTEVYTVAASRLNRRHARSFKPQECSNACWALATAGLTPKYTSAFDTTLMPASKRPTLNDISDDPITECFATAAAEIMRRPKEFKEQEIKDILWGFSRVELRHPALFKMVAVYLVGADGTSEEGRGLRGFSRQGLGNLAWSYAKQAQLSSTVSDCGRLHAIGTTGRQAVYETSCLDIGEEQVNRLYTRIADEAINGEGGMERFKPQDLSNTCWSFAVLGLLHRGYFDNVKESVTKRLSAHISKSPDDSKLSALFKSQEIANLIWSFATLNVRAPDMVDVIADYSVAICSGGKPYDEASIARFFKRQELANVAWSLAVLEQYPPELMALTYVGLLGSDGISGVERLNRLYQDGGMPPQQITTLFYVQMALNMEAPHLGLTLPNGFPSAWVKASTLPQQTDPLGSSRPKELDDLGTTSLKLSSSRLQISISRALEKVGFAHVQEHVIGAEDIFSIHDDEGDTSSFPAEFLSIDIANVEEKIGIEVDGPSHFVNVLDNDSDENEPLQSHAAVTGGKRIKTRSKKLAWGFLSNGRRSVNGPTALKHRLLCHLGWCLIHCPFWEWQALKKDSVAEEEYARDLLEEVI